MRLIAGVTVVCLALAVPAAAQAPAQAPAMPATDRTKATQFTAADLQSALLRLPTDRPSAAVRIFTLAPYNVNVERRLPRPQGASQHDAQAELFYVVDGSATLLTGGTLVAPTRTGNNLAAAAIEGGTRQRFAKGDFLIVPSGLPHQFVDIESPILLMSIYLPNPVTPGAQ